MKVGDVTVRRWWVVAAVAALLALVGYAKLNSTNQAGVHREARLNALYQDNQNKLSAYVSGFYEQLGVAKAKSDKVDTILLDAVKGRYEGKTAARPGGGGLFSAMVEAYPSLTSLDVYDKVVDYVQAGRAAYANDQTRLLDALREYQEWRRAGLLHRALVGLAGFPSNELRAPLGAGRVLRGQAALDQMYVIVLTSDTQKAFQSGTLDPLQVPSDGPK